METITARLSNRNGVVSRRRQRPQPRWGCSAPPGVPRVARSSQPLGFVTESRWDSEREFPRGIGRSPHISEERLSRISLARARPSRGKVVVIAPRDARRTKPERCSWKSEGGAAVAATPSSQSVSATPRREGGVQTVRCGETSAAAMAPLQRTATGRRSHRRARPRANCIVPAKSLGVKCLMLGVESARQQCRPPEAEPCGAERALSSGRIYC